MSDMYFESQNIEKFSWKPIVWIKQLTSWVGPKDVTLRMSVWDVFRTFIQNWKNMQKLTF